MVYENLPVKINAFARRPETPFPFDKGGGNWFLQVHQDYCVGFSLTNGGKLRSLSH
jgi:hypothetical protein